MLREFNLLYIEDQEIIAEIVMSAACELFDEVFYKRNGEEGLAFYKENMDKIDLIITDINMPIMNGLEMAKEIKSIDSMTPIIITTAHNDSKFLLKAIEIGIDSYIVKPIDIKEIRSVSEKILTPKILKKQLKKQEKESQRKLLKSARFTAIGQLAAGLTHEINTPLTYIKGSVEIMHKVITRLDDSREKEILKKQFVRIDDGVNRLVNIIDSMKEVAGKSSEEFVFTNIFETIIIACIMAYNRSKHIVKIKINNEEFTMNMDRNKYRFDATVQIQRVEQVWIIIINNALDELIKVEEFANRELNIYIKDEKENVRVEFVDNAGGINNEIMENIFEPFKSTKDSSGMGIGLSIARKIINEQQGEISVYNNKEGASFEIILPK